METLGRFPLSVMLSYLTESEGTSLLITKKRYAHQLLPIYRVKDALDGLNIVQDQEQQFRRKHRYKYKVCPVQDATILLARLNTRKLYKRKRPRSKVATVGLTTTEIAQKEWREEAFFDIPSDQLLLQFSTSQSDFANQGITLLASYPRSGNSLARTLLERTTGIVTGSDTRPDRILSRELAEQHNLVGEGVTQNVAFVKTHWPERLGTMPVVARRAIVLIRNPYDAIDSYWNMNVTKSHVQTVTDEVYEQYKEKFEALVENEITIWHRFNKYWLEDVDIPVLVVRFEDLIQEPSRELTRMLAFALNVDILSPFWKNRIQHVTGSSNEINKLGSYQPRPTQGGVFIGKSIRKGRYSQKLLQIIHQTHPSTLSSSNILDQLGYNVLQDNFPDNIICHGTPFSVIRNSNNSQNGSCSSLTINEGLLIRPFSCPFGRALTFWRHSITNNDTNPLPTVVRR